MAASKARDQNFWSKILFNNSDDKVPQDGGRRRLTTCQQQKLGKKNLKLRPVGFKILFNHKKLGVYSYSRQEKKLLYKRDREF